MKHLSGVRTVAFLTGVVLLIAALLALPVSTQSAPARQAIQQWLGITTLPEPVIPRAVIGVYNGQSYLYVVGGKSAAGVPVATVRRSAINSDGSLAGWQSTTSLPAALYSHAVLAGNNGRFLYVLGGWNGATRVNTVYRAEVGPNGMLGGWATLTALPEEIAQQSAVLVNNRIYMIGGQNNAATHNKVSVTTIQPDGSLSGWISVTPLPRAVERLSAVTINGWLYATGGSDGRPTGGASGAVYYTRINSNGTLVGWQTTNLPSPRYYHQAVVHDGRLVILGGTADEVNGTAEVWSSTVNSGGWLNGWQVEPALPAALYRMAAVSLPLNGSDTLFVLGGLQGGAYQAAVYRSAVAPTPTFTSTPTITPTATPTLSPGITMVALRNNPFGQVQAGGFIRYTILYRNGPLPVTQFEITNTIPPSTSLVAGSISSGGASVGSLVRWQLGNLAANASGSTSYVVTVNAQEAPADIASSAAISVTAVTTPAAPDSPVITNTGARVAWVYGGVSYQLTSNAVVNPSKQRYLPLVLH